MHILENVTYKFCGKCNNGFKQVLTQSGEIILTPCECKIQQDKDLIYKDLFLKSGVKKLHYVDKKNNLTLSFDNFEEYLNQFHIPYKVEMYVNIYNKYFSNTSTKFVLPINFHYNVFNKDYHLNKENYLIFSNISTLNDEKLFMEFYINFLGDVFLKRLYKVKLLSFHSLMPKILDYTKGNYLEELSDFEILIFTDFFCNDMIVSLKTDYKFEKLSYFLFNIFSLNKFVCIFQSEKYITFLNQIIEENENKLVGSRLSYLLNIILNNSFVVLLLN